MEILSTLNEIKAAAGSGGALGEKLAQLEREVQTLLRAKAEQEAEFRARISAMRHSVAQPLTTVQLFLELLPSVMRQEQMSTERLVNPNYWTQTYGRALDAVKKIPNILAS